MRNKVIDKEQEKVEKFLNKLYDKSTSKAISWFMNGIFLFLIMGLCLMPAQELMVDVEDSPFLMPFVLTVLSSLMVYMRTFLFKLYGENQKSRAMKEILQYYPVSKKALWKYKMSDLVSFMAKVTVVGLLLQIIVAFIAYKTVSLINIVYVAGCVFFFPILGELTYDSIMKTYFEE